MSTDRVFNKPSKETVARIKRARTEDIQFEKYEDDTFVVHGKTDDYVVVLCRNNILRSTCTCPDCSISRNICKHIFRVCFSTIGDPRAYTSKSDRDCCICLETMNKTKVVMCPHCENEFHEGCISNWKNQKCPLCRGLLSF